VQVLETETVEDDHTAFTPAPLLPALCEEFPEIEESVRVLLAGKTVLRNDEDSFHEKNILFVDPSFLTFFSFDLISGDKENALSDPSGIVLSEAMADKYFGDQDPVGKTLIMGEDTPMIVTGVVENIRRTSSLRFEMLAAMNAAPSHLGDRESWQSIKFTTFIKLQGGFNHKQIDSRLPYFIDKYYPGGKECPKEMYLFPLVDFRLKSRHITSIMSASHPASVIVIISIGILLLVIVSINFINLSIARYMRRVKEVAMRKIVGASRMQLTIQFMSESLLLALLALPVTLLLYELFYPIFINYIGGDQLPSYVTSSTSTLWEYPFIIKYLLLAAAISGIASGLYPILVVTAFHPLQIVSGKINKGKDRRWGSKVLIIIQFTLAVIFIAAANVAKEQLNHLLEADYGYQNENVIALRISNLNTAERMRLKTEIEKMPSVHSITASGEIPVFWITERSAILPENDVKETFKVEAYGVDYGFTEMLGLNLLRGRNFSREQSDDGSMVVNQAAVRKFQWNNPIGRQVTVNERTGTVVGVVDDFLFGDIEFGIPPAILYLESEELNYLLIKHSPAISSATLQELLKQELKQVTPGVPFYSIALVDYLDETLGFVDNAANVFNIIGIIAVMFSCVGLLGLASFVVERRTKEISIRKILGASFSHLTWTVMREFLILVMIANIIGLTVIYVGWDQVLRTGLLFMTNIGIGMYLFVIFVSITMAILAVMSQTIRATRANPVDSLKID